MKKSPKMSRAQRRVVHELRRRYDIGDGKAGKKRAMPSTGQLPDQSPRVTVRQPGSSIKKKRHWGLRIFFVAVFLVLISGGVFGYKILAAGNKISTAKQSILGQLSDLLFKSGDTLAGESEDRINLLLLAIGGQGHSGENLADTIMVASINPQTNQVALLSIPRDLYVQVPDEDYYSKINAVHAYGESRKEGSGPDLIKEKVEQITGLPIHYYARVDFTAFKSIVDHAGGISITIDNGFTDYWHKISFPAGTEEMTGDRALAYVRARYIEGPEGGDFKRAARQQQVLLALREKVFSVNTAFDFVAVNNILNTLSDNIQTDMQVWEMKRFFEIARLVDPKTIESVVLTTGHNGVLVGGTEILGGTTPSSILRTRTGDYSEIQTIAANIFDHQTEEDTERQPQQLPPVTPDPEPSPEEIVPVTVEVRNGTNTTGLAAQTQADIEDDTTTVISIGNANNRSTEATTVYVLSDRAQQQAEELANSLGATLAGTLPEEEDASQADVLIILGLDAS